MTDQDAIQMMQRCKAEIQDLRRANNEMAPGAHAYDTIAALIRLLAPSPPQGYSEDIVRKLETEIAKLQTPEAQ